eukprot:TRINITY_DN24145_c0_g1_i1.p1 TRINITY_DN24145_c0_g1~~TRINITY_DN24145_c0_g1_i1.p1  ORF type:complete len:133 (+),score=18.91 TRINITY_DN24145_c0_g1_i1:43-441(+)
MAKRERSPSSGSSTPPTDPEDTLQRKMQRIALGPLPLWQQVKSFVSIAYDAGYQGFTAYPDELETWARANPTEWIAIKDALLCLKAVPQGNEKLTLLLGIFEARAKKLAELEHWNDLWRRLPYKNTPSLEST